VKFLFVFHRFHTNQYFATKYLVQHGHEVRYFVKYKDLAEDYKYVNPEIIPNLKVFWVLLEFYKKFKRGRIKRDTWKSYGVPNPVNYWRKISKYKPDIVIIRDFSFTSIMTIIICKLAGFQCVSYSSRSKYKDKRHVTWKARAFALGQRLKILPEISITPVLGEEKSNSVTSDNIYYVPHCVDIPPEAEKKEFFRDGYINILAVGKYSLPRKNLPLLLQALNNLKGKYRIRLTIVGSYKGGDKESDEGFDKLVKYAEEHKFLNIVDLKVNLAFQDVWREYLRHDVYVFPSSREPNGISHLEAMACGLPVICSDTNGTNNYIENGINGYVFKSDDLNDLTEKIELIINNRNKLKKMGWESLRIIKEKYSSEVVGPSFLEILNNYKDK